MKLKRLSLLAGLVVLSLFASDDQPQSPTSDTTNPLLLSFPTAISEQCNSPAVEPASLDYSIIEFLNSSMEQDTQQDLGQEDTVPSVGTQAQVPEQSIVVIGSGGSTTVPDIKKTNRTCSKCDKVFENCGARVFHQNRCGTSSCLYCGKSFRYKADCKKHEKTDHQINVAYATVHEGNSVTSSKDKNPKKRWSRQPKTFTEQPIQESFTCSFKNCAASFKTKYALHQHEKKTTSHDRIAGAECLIECKQTPKPGQKERYQCPYCIKSFIGLPQFTKHITHEHTGSELATKISNPQSQNDVDDTDDAESEIGNL